MYRQLLYLEEKFKVKKNLAVAITFHPCGTREDEDRWKFINQLRVQRSMEDYKFSPGTGRFHVLCPGSR